MLSFLFSNPERRAGELAGHVPLVILGRGHSGTRVLTWLCAHLGFQLGTSEQNPTADADRTFTNRIKKLSAHTHALTSGSAICPSDLRRFQAAVWDYHKWLGAPATRWGWKFPETYLMVPLVARTFPRARYLHLIRDGRDIAFKSHLTDRPDEPVGHSILSACGALELPHHLQAALSWEYQVNRFAEVRDMLPAPQLLELRFEELCRHPQQVAEQVARFLDVPLTPAAQDYLTRKVNPGKVAQYRHEAPAHVREVEQRIGPTLKRLGYAVPG